MARRHNQEPEVRKLIEKVIIPLYFLKGGDGKAIVDYLNERLKAKDYRGPEGFPAVIHPNRLNGLLSGDVSKGLNDATFKMFQAAAEDGPALRLPTPLPEIDAATPPVVASFIRRRQRFGGNPTTAIRELRGLKPTDGMVEVPKQQLDALIDIYEGAL